MKTKIVPSKGLTTKSLAASFYLPDAFYLPDKKITFRVRVSDNVLEEEAWSVVSVTVKDEIVVRLNLINHGVYVVGIHLGDGLNQVLRWLSYDGTGTHPEQYQEVFNVHTKKWVSCHTREALIPILAGAYRQRPT